MTPFDYKIMFAIVVLVALITLLGISADQICRLRESRTNWRNRYRRMIEECAVIRKSRAKWREHWFDSLDRCNELRSRIYDLTDSIKFYQRKYDRATKEVIKRSNKIKALTIANDRLADYAMQLETALEEERIYSEECRSITRIGQEELSRLTDLAKSRKASIDTMRDRLSQRDNENQGLRGDIADQKLYIARLENEPIALTQECETCKSNGKVFPCRQCGTIRSHYVPKA